MKQIESNGEWVSDELMDILQKLLLQNDAKVLFVEFLISDMLLKSNLTVPLHILVNDSCFAAEIQLVCMQDHQYSCCMKPHCLVHTLGASCNP